MGNSPDIFKSCFSPGYLIAYTLILLAQFADYPLHEYLHVLFFVVLGSLCIYNFKRCGRYHCKITGPGYLGVAVLTIMITFDVITIPWRWIWVAFGAVTVVGFGMEFWQGRMADRE